MAKKTKSIHLKSQHGKLPQVVKVCGCCWLKPKSVAKNKQQNQLRILRIAQNLVSVHFPELSKASLYISVNINNNHKNSPTKHKTSKEQRQRTKHKVQPEHTNYLRTKHKTKQFKLLTLPLYWCPSLWHVTEPCVQVHRKTINHRLAFGSKWPTT